jgi:signal transduction histidine kinase
MTLRVRIALALAASFLIAGAVVLGISALTYQQAVYQSPNEQTDELLKRLGITRAVAEQYIRAHPEVVLGGYDTSAPTPNGGPSVNDAFQQTQREVQRDAVARARVWSIVALGAMAVAAALVGWLIAGRALRPLRSITARARAANATDLSSRVALDGPNDEVRELADTFDEMLARLERVFVSQRQFSAQVSHEIRTPLSVISSETELLLRDAQPEEQGPLHQIHEATLRTERIVAALLALSRSGSGDLDLADLELDRVTGDVLGEVVHEPGWHAVRVDLALQAAPVRADRALLERLIANLLSNSARHNRPDGWIEVRTWLDGAWSVLEVENSVPDGAAIRPVPQAEPDSAASGGIGLTVVDAVLAAHGGQLTWNKSPGSITVQVRLPVPLQPATAAP